MLRRQPPPERGQPEYSGAVDRYSELRARAAEFVAEWAQWGEVLVLAPVREAADEIALAACGDALIGVHRLAFRELVLELSGGGVESPRAGAGGAHRARSAGGAGHAGGGRRRQIELPGAGGWLPGISAGAGRYLRRVAAQRRRARRAARVRRIGRGPGAAARRLSKTSWRRAGSQTMRRASNWRACGSAGQLREKAVVALDLAPRTRSERELLALILNTARAHLDLRLGRGDAPPRSSLESLQRYLFSGDAVPAREEDGSVEIFSTSGEALECVEIARRIGAAVDGGVPFDQTAIPAALAGTLSAAGGGGAAAGGNPGPLHARFAAARCRRAQLSRAAALRRRAALRVAIRRVSLARPDAGGRGAAHARGMGAAAGGRRRDRRARPMGDAAQRAARGVPPALSRRGRRRRARAAGAPHRIAGESARLRPARDRPPGRPSGARHMGRVDCGALRPGRIHAARAGARDGAAGRAGADVGDWSGGSRAKCCWCWVRGWSR